MNLLIKAWLLTIENINEVDAVYFFILLDKTMLIFFKSLFNLFCPLTNIDSQCSNSKEYSEFV